MFSKRFFRSIGHSAGILRLCLYVACSLASHDAACAPPEASASKPEAVSSASIPAAIRVGIMSFLSEGEYTTHVAAEDELLRGMNEVLNQSVPGLSFETTFLRMDALEKAVSAGDVDLFLASSGFFWSMQRKYGARDLATLVSEQAPDPDKGVAGVIFVRDDRTDLQTIADLRRKRIRAGKTNMFLAYQLAAGEIAAAGFDPKKFANIIHDDLPGETVVKAVLSGESDAGMLRACVLEHRYPQWSSSLRIIAPKTNDGLACAHSSSLYPNWTLAATSKVPAHVSKRVAAALLAKPPVNGLSWSLATDFRHVDELEQALKIGPYQYLDDDSLYGLWVRCKEWLILAVALFAGLLAHLLRVERLVSERTQDLSQEIERRRELEEKNAAIRHRVERLERLQLIGEQASMIAHELKQPLAAASYYADAALLLLRRGKTDPEKLRTSMERIRTQIRHTSEVVERVRQYAKKDAPRDECVNMALIMKRVLGELRTSIPISVETVVRNGAESVRRSGEAALSEPFFLRGNSLELEAALLNLLRNAAEAAAEVRSREELHETVRVTTSIEREVLSCVIENAGRVLTKEDLARMNEPLNSTKPEGLGLGLALVRSVTEAHAGMLKIEAREKGGLRVELVLPRGDLDAEEIQQEG